jgi:steroid delta-isomerase-like uncharacterized protein
MSTQSNVQLVRDFFKAMDSGKSDQILSFLAPNAEFKIIGMGEPMRGTSEIKEGFESWNKSFPDLKAQILNVIANEDSVVVEYIGRGTHQGPLESPEGQVLQATNRKIEVPGCDIYKISNGKIVSASVYWLSSVMLRQLGVIPSAKAAA